MKAGNQAWKLDKSLGTNGTYVKGSTTYKWCTGPGHHGVGMWVVHEPGSCKANNNSGSSGTAAAATNAAPKSKGKNKKQTIAALKEALSKASDDMSDDQVANSIWEALQNKSE